MQAGKHPFTVQRKTASSFRWRWVSSLYTSGNTWRKSCSVLPTFAPPGASMRAPCCFTLAPPSQGRPPQPPPSGGPASPAPRRLPGGGGAAPSAARGPAAGGGCSRHGGHGGRVPEGPGQGPVRLPPRYAEPRRGPAGSGGREVGKGGTGTGSPHRAGVPAVVAGSGAGPGPSLGLGLSPRRSLALGPARCGCETSVNFKTRLSAAQAELRNLCGCCLVPAPCCRGPAAVWVTRLVPPARAGALQVACGAQQGPGCLRVPQPLARRRAAAAPSLLLPPETASPGQRPHSPSPKWRKFDA